MHLDLERMQRLLHAELSPEALQLATEHLSGCAECSAQVSEARRSEARVHALLTRLDHKLPELDLTAMTAPDGARGVAWMRWAAGIVLTIALGGVAYAYPGSPVRRLVDSLLRRPAVEVPAIPSAPTPEPSAAPASSGIAVAPGRRLVVVFTPVDSGRVHVVLSDADAVVVRAPTGSATFSTQAGRLEVRSTIAAVYELEIPRAARRIELMVGGRLVLLKEGARVSTSAAPDSSGGWLLPLDRR